MGRLDQVREGIRRAYEAGRASVRASVVEDDAVAAPNPDHGGVGHGAERAGVRHDADHTVVPHDADHTVVAHDADAGTDRTDRVVEDRIDGHTPSSQLRAADEDLIPRELRIAAAWSWRLLLVVTAAVAVIWVVGKLKLVMIPLAIALLLAALLSPAVGWLRTRARVKPSLATALVLIAGIAAVAGTLTLVINEFVNGMPDLSRNAENGIRQIQNWFRRGPLHLSDRQLSGALDAAQNWLNTHREALTSGALTTATTVVEVLAAMFLVLFSTFFFLRDGRKIWYFLVSLLPARARAPIASAGEAGWGTLVAYVRATVLVAFIDAVGIGIALLILRVEFAFPLAALVFLGAFVPIVGATLSGTVAVLVALVTRGPVTALLVIAAVIAVQQLEGHLLQPLIMGRAVAIHPLAVIVAIATGSILAGIIGALVAVPIVAVLNTGVRHLASRRRDKPDPPPRRTVTIED
ncbi:MAG TPA: AI-2E family transporter [Micromonosporaceae bacterium]